MRYEIWDMGFGIGFPCDVVVAARYRLSPVAERWYCDISTSETLVDRVPPGRPRSFFRLPL